MKNNNTDVYKIIKNFLLIVFFLVCAALLITGTQHAGDAAQHRLSGAKYERITSEELRKNFTDYLLSDESAFDDTH